MLWKRRRLKSPFFFLLSLIDLTYDMNKLIKSSKFQQEYCCTVVRIGELHPIENSNYLATTLVNRIQIVVRKDEVKTGDIMIYAANETQLNLEFLSCNNLFELGERHLNKNYQDVQALLDAGDIDGAKSMVGFFNKRGRVKCIRLRKEPSFGFLFGKEALVKWKPELKDINLEEYIGQDFDCVNDELFVKVYVPFVPEENIKKPKEPKEKGVKKINHIIDGQFFKHYDTKQLNRAIDMIKPGDTVNLSVKVHGTSAIFANILCRVPKFINTRVQWWNNLVNYLYICLPEKWQKIEEKYDLIYSSRNVIKNKYIKVSRKKGVSYGELDDLWGEYADILRPYIPEGMTVYGEICGYCTGKTEMMIQKEYDYGCAPGKNKFMPYRITTREESGVIKEWDVEEVYKWTIELVKNNPKLAENIMPIQILYHGTLRDFYPDVPEDERWSDEVLEKMKVDPRLGMEERETLCNNKKVPREGIVLRIDDDPMKEAFKLKCVKFLEREKKLMDDGEIDTEMIEGYTENNEGEEA